jgi:uncharacterized protein YuzE
MAMKLHYYPETDTLYIDLLDEPSVESEEIAPDIIVDYNDDRQIVGLTIDHASERTNISEVEVNEIQSVSVHAHNSTRASPGPKSIRA